ncbi:hypothetical protein [Brachybacterium sp. YJGR34]|uniref:hypothetical protein n=1 Tax=Brachybacterium sp. YJGR34 TaxID=2059911 RepID=UPI000E0BAB7A|nr:hypothetical protein [Brachybacterium sp. YJGR34]
MESRPETTIGHELRDTAGTETAGTTPEVPRGPERGGQDGTWRSSLGVAAALLAAFALVTIASL